MPRIDVDDGSVTIALAPLEKMWAFHGSLNIPLAHIVGASVVDENGWQHMWLKLVGMNWPGVKMAGTFFVDGGLAFLDYNSGQACIVLDTQHETYKTVIVQPDEGQDSQAIVE